MDSYVSELGFGDEFFVSGSIVPYVTSKEIEVSEKSNENTGLMLPNGPRSYVDIVRLSGGGVGNETDSNRVSQYELLRTWFNGTGITSVDADGKAVLTTVNGHHR
ncbi:hypothetical protein L2E82_46513 [Cichorium intybus]|uniref:Uncharacterized protein n=1 Tax=Cichorium intybus TaxID=13427 RepID=A0ACB8YSM2_CICIN|nr:hypothetical protein L1887_26218 [Cichorium endivia]KAI3688724.1 hypothetical protein L2E82_46513 [Cichorium intybus]